MYLNNVRFYVIIKVYKYSEDILMFTIGRFHKDISFPKCIEIKNIRFYVINKIYKYSDDIPIFAIGKFGKEIEFLYQGSTLCMLK